MKLQLTKEVKKTQEFSIPVPSFYKDETFSSNGIDYVAILDEQTAIRVLRINNYISISHGIPEKMKSYIYDAFEKYSFCTEEEFLNAYNESLESISLKPVLIEK